MNILIVGNGKGSWSMRGIQLGAALGARVTMAPSPDDFKWCSVVVLVKRTNPDHVQMAKREGKPIVWDALDFWRQPTQNGLLMPEAMRLLGLHMNAIDPALVIGATEEMGKDASGAYLPHHSWAGLVPTPARPKVEVVAYEGNPIYLGRWENWLETACDARGWALAINPPSLSDADIVVGFRDGQWDGWMARHWKSGVKVVNAIAAGRPFIGQDSAARSELQPEGSIVETREELGAALDSWASYEIRAEVVERSLARVEQFTVSAVAAKCRQILHTVGATCAA
jgi:hypothetical protein